MGCASSASSRGEEKFSQDYSLGEKIGQGAFGQVHLAARRASQSQSSDSVAVKIVPLFDDIDTVAPRLVQAARHESHIMRMVGRHPNCVELLESFEGRKVFYMVMEKCAASLMDRLEDFSPKSGESGLAHVFYQMLLGLAHLHQQRIVHRDVKPHNFLLGGPDARTVKICDFGMATVLPKRRDDFLTGCYGTAPYMSPEMVTGKGHVQNTDIWSMGASAYLLLFGNFPYKPAEKTSRAMKLVILRGSPEPTFTRSALNIGPPSELAVDFVRDLLVRSPLKRSTAEHALQSPFLKYAALDGVTTTTVVDEPSSRSPSHTAKADDTSDPVIRRARIKSHQFEVPMSPTVQRTLDELLTRLSGTFSRSFSDPASLTSCKENALEVIRRDFRSVTHSGVFAESASTESGGSSSTSEERSSNSSQGHQIRT